jgi:hypothetical protein
MLMGGTAGEDRDCSSAGGAARSRATSGRRSPLHSVDFPRRAPMHQDPAEITRQLIELRIEHRDLDAAIQRLSTDNASDELQLKRLKKRKLRLKDMIAYLENQLIPDQPA